MPKHPVEAPRGTTYRLKPEDVTVIYNSRHPDYNPDDFYPHDIDDPSHWAYDPRVHLPVDPEVDADIRYTKEVHEPISVVKEGDALIVTNGRQRRKILKFYNAERVEQGEPPLTFQAMLRRGRERVKLMMQAIASNEARVEDNPVYKAEKIQRMREEGATDEEIRLSFKVKTDATIESWEKTLDLIPELQQAIVKGKVTLAKALSVYGKSVDQQKAILNGSSKRQEKKERKGWLIYRNDEPVMIVLTEKKRDKQVAELEEAHPRSKISHVELEVK